MGAWIVAGWVSVKEWMASKWVVRRAVCLPATQDRYDLGSCMVGSGRHLMDEENWREIVSVTFGGQEAAGYSIDKSC
jgi:hypothetical protein